MDVLTSVFIGIGLAMDASAVSIAGGANAKKKKTGILRSALMAGLFFGAFQAGMIFLGGIGGESAKALVSGIDHWIAFALLAFVGGKMVIEAFREPEERKVDLLHIRMLFILAIATSIDALAVGVGLAFIDHSLIASAIIVGITTALISIASVFIGHSFGHRIGNKVEIVGGMILIAIGANILQSHLFA